MPIKNSNVNTTVKKFSLSKEKYTNIQNTGSDHQFLTIAPALPLLCGLPILQKLNKNSATFSSKNSAYQIKNDLVGGCNIVTLQQTEQDKFVVACRDTVEREKNPDRICLDRRGLTDFPWVVDEPKLRLISLQHNLISEIKNDHLLQLTKLVFLDLYNNQIDKFCSFDPLENLRVLLMGKNRIKKIEGLKKLSKLEVLDLHGNQIMQVSGLEGSNFLKVLNLAGNNIKDINHNDFQGLSSLKELNLRRNKIKKIFGLGSTPSLKKLYLSNNDIQKIEDMGSIVKALEIKELSMDGNPVTLTAECVPFLVSYLPNLQVLSAMQINEQARRNAMAWRTLKEQSNSVFLNLSTQVCINVRREEVISNAKTNWELLKSQTKCFTSNINKMNTFRNDHLRSFSIQSTNAVDVSKIKSLNRSKCKDYESLNLVNENSDVKISNKKRNNSVDNLSKIDSLNQTNALEFKLPPILIPIIDNLNNKINASQVNTDNSNYMQQYTDSSNSDVESSESHKSLKSGLRNHLVKSIRRDDTPVECEKSDINCSYMKNNIFSDVTLLNSDLYSKSVDCLDKNIKNFNFQENQLSCRIKPTVSETKFGLISKCNSLDNKLYLDDSSSSLISSSNENRISSAQTKKIIRYKSNRAATARAKHKVIFRPNPSSQPLLEREQGGDYLVEIVGRCLNIFGQGALRFIDKQWDSAKASEIIFVKFNYVQFNGVASVLNKLKVRFPNSAHFYFKETNINHLGQLNALAEAQGFNSIQIEAEGNPIISKYWKSYAVFRLAHWGLQTINGSPISDETIQVANQEYSSLIDIIMWSLPESLLQPLLHRLSLDQIQKQSGEQISAKQFLINSHPALKHVVAREALQWRRGNITQDDLIWRHKGKIHFSYMIDQTVNAIQKLQIFDTQWPIILYELIYKILNDYSNMDGYMKYYIADINKR